jgi:signal transduction histidine kinase
MSHELRTPLNAILNFTEIVALEKLGSLTERQKSVLQKSLDSGKHLLDLINDVLDMTKIESGMMELFVEDQIDLYEELRSIIPATEILLKDKPVALIQDIDSNLPTILGDRRRIRQILLNLFSNAVKFTDKGSITLSVKTKSDGSLLFAVIDTGPGIPFDQQSMIFEPFVQTETGIKQNEGTGLGLPISRRLAEAHGGALWVESEPGDGAAFYLSLPIRTVELEGMLQK